MSATSQTLYLYLSEDDVPYALDYFVSPIPHDGSCPPTPPSNTFPEHFAHLNTTILLRKPSSPPSCVAYTLPYWLRSFIYPIQTRAKDAATSDARGPGRATSSRKVFPGKVLDLHHHIPRRDKCVTPRFIHRFVIDSLRSSPFSAHWRSAGRGRCLAIEVQLPGQAMFQFDIHWAFLLSTHSALIFVGPDFLCLLFERLQRELERRAREVDLELL